MAALIDTQQEAFCQHRAQQKSLIEAYVLAGYKSHRGHASRLGTKGHIKNRIAEIQGKYAAKSQWKVEEAIATMREITDNPKSKGSDRVSAARAAASWLGWEKGTQAENTIADTLKDGLLARVRARRK